MISPYGVKVNMVCASCEYCKMQRVPAPTYWRNKCLKNNKWLTNTSSFCDSYKMVEDKQYRMAYLLVLQ